MTRKFRLLIAAALVSLGVAFAPSGASADLLSTTTSTVSTDTSVVTSGNLITEWWALLPSLSPTY
jgi:hypothetical protein